VFFSFYFKSNSLIFLILTSNVSAYCWQQSTQATCIADTDESCKWKNDSLGGWCQVLDCWSLYNQTDCETTSIPNRNCTWQGGGTTYSCEQMSCYSFDGTNQTTCENNSAGLSCQWNPQCWSSGGGGGTWTADCYSFNTEATCKNNSGCSWGSCNTKGCWNYNLELEIVLGGA